jgi:excisionase family DNA binding protein
VPDYKLLTISEVAKIMKVSQKTVYRWIDSGQLRTARLGRKVYRVFERDLIKFINRHIK